MIIKERKTNETDIKVSLELYGIGKSNIDTGVPFLDHRIFEFAWNLPVDMKIKNGTKKWILQQVLNKYLPLKLFNRPKMGFGIPVGYWIRGPLKDWAIDSLNFEKMKKDEFYDVNFVYKVFHEHQSGERNWGQLIWSIIAFQNWHAQISKSKSIC